MTIKKSTFSFQGLTAPNRRVHINLTIMYMYVVTGACTVPVLTVMPCIETYANQRLQRKPSPINDLWLV